MSDVTDAVLSVLGLSSAAMVGWYALAFVAAIGAGAVGGGILVHDYDQAQHDKVVADLRAEAATALADEQDKLIAKERSQAAQLAQLETDYAALSDVRERLAGESARLSSDLAAALERVRRVGADRPGGGGRLSPTAANADGCQDLRAALGRTTEAMERLKSGGDEAARIGQHAVDVATTAAQAARQVEAAHE